MGKFIDWIKTTTREEKLETFSKVNLGFVTGIRISKDVIKYFNDITFFHDPNWDFNGSEVPTFPITFFSIKGQHEVMRSEISKKPLLFYNSQSPMNKDSITGSLINIVSDNIINQPKSYKLDVLIPSSLSALTQSSHVWNTADLVSTIIKLSVNKTKEDTELTKIMHNISYSAPYVKFIVDLILMFLPADNLIGGATLEQFITSVSASPDFNKNSLERMWENRGILRFKPYNSWNYKYVSIVDLDISKEPTEDNMYQGAITVQEVPIITTKKLTNVPKFSHQNDALTSVARALTKLIESKKGV